MLTIGEQLKNNFSNKVNKEGDFFKALIANDKQTGAIESVLKRVSDFIKYYTGTPNIYEQSLSMLDATANFFSYLERYVDEFDEAYKSRIYALFGRSGLNVWGNKLDLILLFNAYFPNANIFVVENSGNNSNIGNENLILDFDFQDDNSTHWNLENCVLSKDARFSQSKGVLLGEGKVSQTVNNLIPNTNYFLHSFIKGNCYITITDENNRYWNNTVEYDVENQIWYNGKWQDEEYRIQVSHDDWDNFSIQIKTGDSINNLTITYNGINEDCFVDYIRLFQYRDYPSLTVIAHFESSVINQQAAALADGTNDEQSEKLNNYSYHGSESHDYSFISGVQNGGYAQDIYEDLIEYVKAMGVKAYIEIVNRDE